MLNESVAAHESQNANTVPPQLTTNTVAERLPAAHVIVLE